MLEGYRAVAVRRDDRPHASAAEGESRVASSGRARWLGAAVALTAAGSATAVGGGLTPIFATAQQTIETLAGRSPGVRTEANTTKGKARVLARTRAKPIAPAVAPPRIARALPRVLDRGRAPALAPYTGTSGASLVEPNIPGPGAILPTSSGGAFVPGTAFPPFTGITLPGGGGGGGGVIIVPPGTPVPEVPGVPGVPGPPGTAPVPEPASWVLLILGFGLIGRIARRRRRDMVHG